MQHAQPPAASSRLIHWPILTCIFTGFRYIDVHSDRFDLDQVGAAGTSGYTGTGNDDLVTGLKIHGVDRCFSCHVEENFGGWQHFAHLRCDSPGEGERTPGLFICRQTDDIDRTAETGYHLGNPAGQRAGNDRLRIDIHCHCACRMGNGIHVIVDIKAAAVEILLVVN